jgi:hypothetical protein
VDQYVSAHIPLSQAFNRAQRMGSQNGQKGGIFCFYYDIFMKNEASAAASTQSQFNAECQDGSGMKSIYGVQQEPVVKFIASG